MPWRPCCGRCRWRPSSRCPAEPTETPTPVQTIAATQEAGDDRRIAERIAGIFAELPAFGAVEVEVNEGVVSLSGTVPKPDDIARAEAIVNRVAGVVTVENGLERDLSLSAGSAGILTLADRWNSLVRMLPLIGMALGVWLAIAFLGYLIAGLGRLWHRIAPNSFLAELIASAIRFGFTIVGLVIALDMIGATALLGAVLGGAGVIGIALGFAMRDTIENYVASLLLSLRQPFRANDWVQIDTYEGRVIRLTSRATVLMTLDGNHLRIPNGQVFKAVIVNFTRNPQRRFHFDLGVDADDDARAARQLGLVGPAAVFDAIGEAGVHGLAAEMEIGFARVSHRPAAYLVRQIQQAGLVGDFGARLGRDQAARRRWGNRGLLVTGTLAQEATRPDRDDLGQVGILVRHRLRRVAGILPRCRRRCCRFRRGGRRSSSGRLGCGLRRFLGRRCLGRGLGGSGGLLLVVGLDRRRARLETEAVRLADHGIAAHPAQLVGDLAGGRTAFPHLLKRCDPFVGPAHVQSCISCLGAAACMP
ncbi:MAG TPA: hypothetical protein DD795_10315 [Erythrobacter sp.]|nr:hypothetical protein [Erythrobacter sp.]